ncbi:Hypothetical protein PHPALM_18494 [Phytophthora palmivora]|uniref:Uncharacterized protein n=1 Tax=Phytophthora palmivora TaxID=4796 RepID=A0A2P4XJT7_9STRA|nr:Hypothetical protein PHPALM_18494 [Phytophthora palmivora]
MCPPPTRNQRLRCESRWLVTSLDFKLVVSDNVYIWHTFARAVMRFTDNEMHLLGAVRFNLVERWNKAAFTESVARVAARDCGSWELVAAVDPVSDREKKGAKYKKAQHKKEKQLRTTYQSKLIIAEKAGYIVLKDRKVAMFYTNNLNAIYVNGSCCILSWPTWNSRWTDECFLQREVFMVPTPIASTIFCMNGVDSADQMRSTNQRVAAKEPRNDNFYVAYRSRDEQRICTYQNYRASEFVKRRQKKSLADIVGLNTSLHIFTPISTAHSNGKRQCYLGNLRGIKKKSKSRYGILRRFPTPRHTQRSHTDHKTLPVKIDIGHVEPRSRTRKIDDSTATRRSE